MREGGSRPHQCMFFFLSGWLTDVAVALIHIFRDSGSIAVAYRLLGEVTGKLCTFG